MIRLLMVSTDRKLLDPTSSVAARTLSYARFCEAFTVILAGTGEYKETMLGPVRIVFPGGRSKFQNFFKMRRAARIEARTLKPTVVTAQDPFFIGIIASVAARVAKAPLQIQVHTDYFNPAFIFESLRHFVEFCVSYIPMRRASCVRVVSERIGVHARRYTRAPVSELPIRVHAEAFMSPHPRPPEYGDHPVILAVSRLTKEKRVHLIIDALQDVPNAHLYIIGDGPLRAALERRAKRRGVIERTHFLGWKSGLSAYYQHATCFVQVSRYEGYGMTLVEAVLADCPVATTDVGLIGETIQPGPGVTVVRPQKYDIARVINGFVERVRSGARGNSARAPLIAALITEEEYLKKYQELLQTCGAH